MDLLILAHPCSFIMRDCPSNFSYFQVSFAFLHIVSSELSLLIHRYKRDIKHYIMFYIPCLYQEFYFVFS